MEPSVIKKSPLAALFQRGELDSGRGEGEIQVNDRALKNRKDRTYDAPYPLFLQREKFERAAMKLKERRIKVNTPTKRTRVSTKYYD